MYIRLIKRFIIGSAIYKIKINRAEYRSSKREYLEWLKNDRYLPLPHLLKQKTIQDYAKKYALRVFIETGTYSGRMVESMINYFDQIYSIELKYDLYIKAKDRFRNKRNIKIIWGDSGSELLQIITKIHQPCLFWLDGHYSGEGTAKGDKETPILEELKCILNKNDYKHVILIDDARLFGNVCDYPSIDELNKFIISKDLDIDLVVDNDIIRITPK